MHAHGTIKVRNSFIIILLLSSRSPYNNGYPGARLSRSSCRFCFIFFKLFLVDSRRLATLAKKLLYSTMTFEHHVNDAVTLHCMYVSVSSAGASRQFYLWSGNKVPFPEIHTQQPYAAGTGTADVKNTKQTCLYIAYIYIYIYARLLVYSVVVKPSSSPTQFCPAKSSKRSQKAFGIETKSHIPTRVIYFYFFPFSLSKNHAVLRTYDYIIINIFCNTY